MGWSRKGSLFYIYCYIYVGKYTNIILAFNTLCGQTRLIAYIFLYFAKCRV